jgi:hypothetical protein
METDKLTVLLHCYGCGDPDVGIQPYSDDFTITAKHGPLDDNLITEIQDVLIRWIDMGPSVIVCPGAECPVCYPACETCGAAHGKPHRKGCPS